MDPLLLICLIVFILWAMGAFVFTVGGSAIHLLLVIVVIIILVRLLQGRSVL